MSGIAVKQFLIEQLDDGGCLLTRGEQRLVCRSTFDALCNLGFTSDELDRLDKNLKRSARGMDIKITVTLRAKGINENPLT